MEKGRLVILSSVFLLFLIPGILVNNAFAIITSDTLYACDKAGVSSKDIHKLDKTDGTIISSEQMSIVGIPDNELRGCIALSQDPTDEMWYVIVQSKGDSTNRNLATIDPETGNGIKIDSMDGAFTTLAFSSDGSLFTSTGQGSEINDVLFSVDKISATVSQLCDLPDSNSLFNYLVYNWNEDVLYRLAGSGIGFGDGDVRLDRIDDMVGECDVTTTPISGDFMQLLFNASFNTDDNLYYILARYIDENPGYYSLTVDGSSSLISDSSFELQAKGIAFELVLTATDTDGDGVGDDIDNCLTESNPD